MKEELVRTPFDHNVYEDKVYERWLGYQGELQKCTDKKSEIFIQVNYFHSILDDAMEFLLKSSHARGGIHPKSAIKILFDRGILSKSGAKSASKLNKIRNFFAHDYNNPDIQSNAEKIIKSISIELTHLGIVLDETSPIDYYEKLNFIIMDYVIDLETHIRDHKD
jgi:uncharacterized protein YutE (UPF0331/DUF86 family)